MKGKIKNRTLASMLTFTMIASSVSLPTNLVLAKDMEDIISSEETSSEEKSSEEISSEETSSEETSSEETSSEETSSEEISGEETSSEEISGEETSSEEISGEETSSEEISGEETSSEEISGEETSSEEISGEETSSEEISGEETSSEEISSEAVSSEEVSSEEVSKDKEIQELANNEGHFIFENGVITGYDSRIPSIGELVIPVQIMGKDVTSIADNAFTGRNITKLTFAEGSKVTSIGENAFANNPIEGSVNIPSSVKTIGVGAFKGCSKITSVTILEGVTFEENGNGTSSAFEGCTSLAQVTLPNSMTKIPGSIFRNCSLTEINIPASVRSIGSYAFYGNKIEQLNIPASVRSIGSYAFYGNSIEEIVIPETVTNLGTGVFSYNNSLTKATLPNNMTVIPDNLFAHCSNLTDVNIPNNVTKIGSSAFNGCNLQGKLTLSDNVIELGSNAFNGNKKLTEVEIGSGIQKLGYRVFDEYVKKITIDKNKPLKYGDSYYDDWYATLWNTSGVPTVLWKDTVETDEWILDADGYLSKYKGTSKENLEIPSQINNIQVKYIGKELFKFEYGIKNVTIPEGVLDIRSYVFSYCYDLETVTMPNSITEIKGRYVFMNTDKLETVKLPENLTSIPSGMFFISGLQYITLPDSIKKLESQSFSNCRNLKELILPEGVEKVISINNTGIERLNIPSTVKEIASLDGIKEVYLPHHEVDSIRNAPWGAETIYWKGVHNNGEFIFTQTGRIEKYIGTGEIVTVPSQLKIPGSEETVNITSIASEAFYKSNIKEVTIEEGIKTIGSKAFAECPNLTTVKLPEGLTDLGDKNVYVSFYGVFYGCNNLESVNLPSTLSYIATGTFAKCNLSGEIVIPEGVEKIGILAFQNNKNITKVIVPSSCKIIEEGPFEGCTSLEEVVLQEGLQEIGRKFVNNTAVKSITIPSSVEKLDSTFLGNNVIEEVILLEDENHPSSLKALWSTFAETTNLKTVTIPSTVTTMIGNGNEYYGNNVFSNSGVEKIMVNQDYNTSPLRNSQPWGAKEGTKVYFKGKIPAMKTTKMVRTDANNFDISINYTAPDDTAIIKTKDYHKNTENTTLINPKNNETRDYQITLDNLNNINTNEYIYGAFIKPVDRNMQEQPGETHHKVKLTGFVSYVDNDGNHLSKDGISVDTKRYTEGRYTIAYSLSDENFLGWATKPNSTKVEYVKGQEVQFDANTRNLNLYPVYGNKLTLTDGVKNYHSEYYETGSTVDLNRLQTTEKPSKEGYKFLGWSENKNATEPITSISLDADKTLYPVFEKLPILTLNFNDGITSNETIVSDDNYIVDISNHQNPTRTGYTFDGWYDGNNKITGNTVTLTKGTDKTITAKWIENTVTINFDAQGGKVDNSTLDKKYNESFILPTPTRIGYTFAGWYTMPQGAGTQVGNSDKLWEVVSNDDSITLYAKWIVNEATINYYTNGGEIVTLTRLLARNAETPNFEETVEFDSVYTLKSATKAGHSFTNWTTKDGTVVTEDNLWTLFDETLTLDLYANYDALSYEVTYDVNGGNPLKNDKTEVTYGQNYQLEVPTRTGYTFDGWYNGDDKIETTGTWNTVGNVNVVAKWTANTYTVTYDADGGSLSGNSTINVTYDAEYTLEEPTKTGYTFEGWYNGDDKIETTGTWNITSNVNVVAKWTANTYTVTYNADGGNLSGDNTIKVTYDSSYTLEEPTKTGYTFGGWYRDTVQDGNQISTTGTWNITSDVNLIAKWTPNTYTVTYNVNTGDELNPNTIKVTYDAEYTLAEPTKEGYIFAGWYNGTIQKGNEIPTEGTWTIPNDVTLVASWSKEKYTVTYDVNDGIELDNNTQQVEFDSDYTLATPQRIGYKFVNWTYNGTEIPQNGKWNIAENVTLTANWEAKPVTINYYDDGKVLENGTQNVSFDEKIDILNPTKQGYTFAGWRTVDGKQVLDYLWNENIWTLENTKEDKLIINLYASWVTEDATINFNANGGTIEDLEKLQGNPDYKEIVEFNSVYVLPQPSKTGYTFKGWYKTSSFEEDSKITNYSLWKNFDENLNITLYAKFEANTYKVSYTGYEAKNHTVVYDREYSLYKPSRDGYTFKGWKDEQGNKVENTGKWKTAKDVTLRAIWEEIPTTTTETPTETTSLIDPSESTTITTERPTESTTEGGTETTTNTTNTTNTTEASTEGTSETSTEATTREMTTEASTEETTITQTENNTETTVIEDNTEETTDDTDNIIENVNNNNGGDGGERVYQYGNLEEITPEYEELARQAIQNIEVDTENINNTVDSVLENVTENGNKINEKRLTEKPAFGFGEAMNTSLLVLLLLLLILLVIVYVVKKQIFDKEKAKEEKDDDVSLKL